MSRFYFSKYWIFLIVHTGQINYEVFGRWQEYKLLKNELARALKELKNVGFPSD